VNQLTGLRCALIAVTVLILPGCSSHYSTSDVAGKYALSINGGVDTIELDATGAYRHSYKAETGQNTIMGCPSFQ